MGLTDLCFRGLSQAAGLISLKSQEVKSEKDFSLSLAFLAMTDKRSCDLSRTGYPMGIPMVTPMRSFSHSTPVP